MLFVVTTQKVEAAPPTHFQVTPIITSGLDGPSGFEIAPDGRLFILERTGKIKIYKNGQLLPTPFAELPSIATGDRGLIGIAFDPDFNTNHYVYFYYTGLDQLNRLVRFNAATDVGLDGPLILYQTTFPSDQLHVGGSIRFGDDGKLYFAVGDNGYPPNGQDLSNPHGKILRINKDGTIPADNPFVGVPGVLPEIWAYGFRNPWRFQFDSVTGKLYGGDVGDFTIEELNRIEKGKNYGWPICEGVCSNSNFLNPIFSYPHAGESAAITGGPVYRGSMFPQEYQGNVFFADYAKGFIKRCVLTTAGTCSQVLDFDTRAGSVVDMKVAPDGSMYYVTYIPGRIYRITYSEGNHLPIANVGADVTKGTEPLTVHFTSAGSMDPDGDNLTYLWDFGDGTSSTEANPTKTYNNKGTYTVELRVNDGTNTAISIPVIIQVGIAPTVTIALPKDGGNYRAGDKIVVNVFASDAAGFDLNDASIKTEMVLHHDTHIHPFYGPAAGRAHEVTLPTHGEASANTWYEIFATATDGNGLSTTKSINIYPLKSKVGILSNISGVSFFLDGVPHTAGIIIEGVENFVREISTQVLQQVNGVWYGFKNWSDGGMPKHNITIPTDDTNITANFVQLNKFKGEYFYNVNLAGNPVLIRFDDMVQFKWDEAAPDPLLPIDNFSVRWTATQTFPLGKYKFTTSTDDGVRLYVDGQLLIDKWVDQGTTDYIATTNLTEGDHQIIMEYYEKNGGAVARLNWELTPDQPTPVPTPTITPTPTPNPVGYLGEYFDNMTFSGTPKLTRQDTDINFVWNESQVDPVIPTDHYSVRWARVQNFETGTYRFTTTSDDGIRVKVDGEVILDKMIDQPSTTYSVDKFITAGSHNIVVEYYENYGGAIAKFGFDKISDTQPTPTPVATPIPGGGYLAKYWNFVGDVPATIPTTAPVLQREDNEINFVWNETKSYPEVNVDKYIASWTKDQVFESGNYRFTTESDDGVRVYVDGQIIIDQWNDHAKLTHQAEKVMTAGVHQIRVDYYENLGGAIIKFNFEKITGQVSNNFLGEYFDNQNLTGNPKLTREDSLINFLWQMESPDALIPADHFSVRWTKVKQFSAGNHSFEIKTDDGVRFYVDDQLIVDDWTNHAMKIYTPAVNLTAGNHTLKIEYFDNDQNAIAIFEEK